MSRQISEEIVVSVKDLIKQMSGYEEGTEVFTYIEKHILTTIKKSDTMYFLNKREVDDSISGMAEKFIFHGFFSQAKSLQDSYKAYVFENLPKSELVNRLNIVKLLLCLSERPTSNFLENPEEFESGNVEEEEEINWVEYLNEGIERWSPNFDETTDASDNSFSEVEVDVGNKSGMNTSRSPIVIDGMEKDIVVDLRTNREELLATIQHTWYNQERFHMAPFSKWKEANIGILWDKFLEDQVKGLIPIEKSNVLSEYKVIREILWQFWSLHTSAVFELEGDTLKPKSNITISSVRAEPFENFLNQFIPYMEILDYFREFSKSLEITNDEAITAVPQTYRSYNNSLQNIIQPVYKKLSELEDRIREQETTYTLLKLCDDLQSIFELVVVLKKIHKEVVVDFHQNSPVRCATILLCSLHNSLQYSASKLEQDLRLTLLLESLYHYFTLIDSWLMKNDLSDYSEEFVIINKNKNLYESTNTCFEPNESVSDSENWMLNFTVRDGLDEFCENNTIMKIIRETVLQIGRNIHLLRTLGKFSLINDCKETIHTEFVRKCLEGLDKFFRANLEPLPPQKTAAEDTFYDCITEKKYKYPVVCTDECKKPTDFDKLDNLVDTSDGFLMLAFEDYFVEKFQTPIQEDETLFEKVSKITTTMFPTSNFFERILNSLLKDRFTISGLMVKNILIEEFLLEKQFQFLRHIFLFCDDLIFPFYRRLFEKANACDKNWGNDIWLTSHLQDIIMDVHPEFYEKCLVQVKDTWRQCLDPLDACEMLTVQYEIQWPLNIIISSPQMALYKDLFGFIMKIKWALYTLNHLVFTDLEPKKLDKNRRKMHGNTIMKLKYLKFALTNITNSIQHYIFAFVFTKCLQKFELDFEKANDLSSIMASHSNFINDIYRMVMDIKQSGKSFPAFKNVMSCVKLLKMMWTSMELATPKRLSDCYKIYKKCHSAIEPIVCPVYIFDY